MRIGLFCAAAGAAAVLACAPAAAQEAYISQIMVTAGSYCPEGTIPTDGRKLSIRDHQALFSLLMHRFGGDARADFKVPTIPDQVLPGGGKLRHCIVDHGSYPPRPEHE